MHGRAKPVVGKSLKEVCDVDNAGALDGRCRNKVVRVERVNFEASYLISTETGGQRVPYRGTHKKSGKIKRSGSYWKRIVQSPKSV